MAYKDILVIVDATPSCAPRLRLATALAGRFDAHLTGLFTVAPPQIPTYIAAHIPEDAVKAQRMGLADAVELARGDFDAAVAAAGINGEWRQAEGSVRDHAILHGRYADFVVVGQDDPDQSGALGTEAGLPEQVALAVGRPVLAVPYAGKFTHVGRRVLVAWDASREAARAIGDAMPLIEGAEHVVVVAVDGKSGREAGSHGALPGADMSLHLARHGVKVAATHLVGEKVAVGDTLLNRVADEAADLLVMGAYGRSRFSEFVLGGVTRHILGHMTVPVLMSH